MRNAYHWELQRETGLRTVFAHFHLNGDLDILLEDARKSYKNVVSSEEIQEKANIGDDFKIEPYPTEEPIVEAILGHWTHMKTYHGKEYICVLSYFKCADGNINENRNVWFKDVSSLPPLIKQLAGGTL